MNADRVDRTDTAVPESEHFGYWSDERLCETYRRLSRDLRAWGFDERTVDRLGRVEVALRSRGLDPDPIAREVADEHRREG